MFCEPFAAVVPYFFRLTLGFVNFCEQYQIHWPKYQIHRPQNCHCVKILMMMISGAGVEKGKRGSTLLYLQTSFYFSTSATPPNINHHLHIKLSFQISKYKEGAI